MPIYLGLDCGGSASRAMLIDSEGKVIFEGKSGPANASTTPRAYLAMSVKRALEGCPKPDYVCGCFGGLVSAEQQNILIRLIEGFVPGAVVRVYPDYYAAFAATMDPDACCIVAGTGSLVITRVDGEVKKSGGNGPLLGDEGSAFSVGREGLRAYIRKPREQLGKSLLEGIPRIFGVDEPQEIVARVYHDLNPAARIALLAQNVAQDWEAGEEYAKGIIHYEMGALSMLAHKHLDQYHPEDQSGKSIFFAGGLWEISPIFQEVFTKIFREHDQSANRRFAKISHPPVYGAALLARQLENEHRESKPEVVWSR